MIRKSILILAAAVVLGTSAAAVHSDAAQAAQAQVDWQKAATDDESGGALSALIASDHVDAAKFLIGILDHDAALGDLRPGWREKVWTSMSGFRSAGAIDALIAALRAIDSETSNSLAFRQFELLFALASNPDSDTAMAEVRASLRAGKSPWLTTAAVEAVRAAEVHRLGAGARFLPEVLALLDSKQRHMHEQEILTINVFACLSQIADRQDRKQVVSVVNALVKWQEWSKNEVPRLRDMADRTLISLTGEDCTLKTETLGFWKWWARQQAAVGNDEQPPKLSRTAPRVFQEPIAGTRTVFVIDTSDSMKWEIDRKDRDRLAKQAPHLDWKRIRTPMELAIAELSHALEKLKQEKRPKFPRGTSSEVDLAYPHFAIVTYNREVRQFTNGWVPAYQQNCDHWIGEIKKLAPAWTTNIHAALLNSMGLGSNGRVSDKSEIDRDCILNGAHTIVLLTDGYPTWSEDSKATNQKDDFSNPVGDGAYVKRANLLCLARTINRFRHVVINTVGIGQYDRELMEGLARDSDGTCTDWSCKINYKQPG